MGGKSRGVDERVLEAVDGTRQGGLGELRGVSEQGGEDVCDG